ncbi:MAG: RimK/LysX family protein [Nitriliruptorales bacterium]|nr:RimK/LysX family protein [Nitriliruptorales bacterium]
MSRQKPRTVLGWREWAALPDFGVERIKVKLDTGARTSALHAFGLKEIEIDGLAVARFEIHPIQRSTREPVLVQAPIIARRAVRSSTGHRQNRPVIRTPITIGERTWEIDVTLTQRDEMGFRMLLGRRALRGVLVDSSRSWLGGRRIVHP